MKMMEYNGKKVFDLEEWNYYNNAVGDYATDAVVDDMLDALPPACMRSDCSQLGEPYSHREDPESGKWRATYATFKRVAKGVWEYCGHCFRGENVERGKDPCYVGGDIDG